MVTPLPELSSAASPNEIAATLEDSLNQLLQLREQMNAEIDSHLERLREMRSELNLQTSPRRTVANLFESPPEGCVSSQSPVLDAPRQVKTRLAPIAKPAIDPDLEQSTLDELNEALAQAFAQMSGHSDRD